MDHKLALLLLLVCCSSHSSEARSNVDKINSYLAERSAESDFAANMQAARDYLARQESSRIGSRSLRENLKSFIGLEKIQSEAELCSEESRQILANNIQLFGDAATSQPDSAVSSFRLKSMLAKVQLKHKDACCSVYPRQYEKLLETFSIHIEPLEAIANKLVNRRELDPKRLLSANEKFADHVDGRLAYEDLAKAMKERKDGDAWYLKPTYDEDKKKGTVVKSKIEALLKSYLVEPCKNFADKMSEMFEPYSSELTLCGGQLSHTYYLYDVCRKVIANQAKLTASVIKYASEKFY